MRFDVNSDLRAATLLSALGLDPQRFMSELDARSGKGLDTLGDGYDRVGDLGPFGILNLLQRGALPPGNVTRPGEAWGRTLRGWPAREQGFDPSQFPPGTMGRRMAGLFRNEPFARQELERALGGRILPS